MNKKQSKSTTILFLLLGVIIGSMVSGVQIAVDQSNSSNSIDENKIMNIKNTNIGKGLLNFAELTMAAEAPMDDLVSAITQLVKDIQDRAQELHEEFNQRGLRYQSQKTRLNDDISSAQIDVSNNVEALSNTLYPGLQLLQKNIQQLGNNIDENSAYVAKISTQRDNQNAAYNDRVSQKNDALQAIDQCLDIIKQVSSGNIALAENADSIQNALGNIAENLQNQQVDQGLVQVLAELAMQKFADQGALLAVSNALSDVKLSILNDLQAEHDDEVRLVNDFNQEKSEKAAETRDFQQNLIILQSELQTQQDQIAQTENFVDIRKQDLSNFNGLLQAEEKSFQSATASYESIFQELQKEEAVANDTLQLIQNAGFADYLSQAISN